MTVPVETPPAGGAAVLPGLSGAVDAVLGVAVGELGDGALTGEMVVVQRETVRLQGRLASLAAERRRRAAKAAAAAAPEDPRAGEKAARQTQQDIADQLGVTAGEAGRLVEAGRQLAASPTLGEAARAGKVRPGHARTIARTLRDVEDPAVRAALEGELTGLAPTLEEHAFRRAAVAALARADAAAAEQAERRRRSSRSARTFTTDDGMWGLSARLSGTDAVEVEASLDAFRTVDATGERRRPEQRTADALVAMARHALRHVDTTAHGHPPQTLVVIDRDTATSGRGVVWVDGTPLPASEARPLVSQSRIAALLRGGRRTTEVTCHTRHQPRALWELLVVRDGGCIADGCDAKPGWTDVVHLHIAFEPDGGRLSESNAALVCRRHHRAFDLDHTWVPVWHDGRPRLVRPAAVDRHLAAGATRQPPGWLPPPTADPDAAHAARRARARGAPQRPPDPPRPTDPDQPDDDPPRLLAEERGAYATGPGPPAPRRRGLPSRGTRHPRRMAFTPARGGEARRSLAGWMPGSVPR